MAGSDLEEFQLCAGDPLSALLADENVPRAVLDRLRADGWSVAAIAELAQGDSDAQVMARADYDSRVLITQDRDFGELAIARGLPVRGVVLLELERLSLSSQAERASVVLSERRNALIGFFTVVEPARVRRRPLDRATKPA